MAAMAVAGIAAASAAPAGAATAGGTAAIILASHAKGRTLSGQGVAIQAGSPATKDDRTLSLPISAVDPGAGASATADGWLHFKRGKKGVVVSALRFDFAAGILKGKIGDEEISIFSLGAAASLNASTGAVSLQDAKLRLTADAADTLKQKLGLERALRRDGVGMAWLSAKAKPVLEATKSVASGNAAWGMLASWRAYVLGHQGPPPPAPPTNGTIEVSGGATATGPPNDPATTYAFPAVSGSFEKGLYGATDKLVLQTPGQPQVRQADALHPGNRAHRPDADDRWSQLVDRRRRLQLRHRPVHRESMRGPAGRARAGHQVRDPRPERRHPDLLGRRQDGHLGERPGDPDRCRSGSFAPTYKAGQPLDPVTITVTTG